MLSLDGDDPVAIQLRASGRKLAGVAVFSGVVNLLTLSGSLYMLQVYDRVIPSHNVATLVGLSAIVAIAYLLQGYFDALRGRMLTRIGALFDVKLQPQIHFALVSLPLRGTKPILAQQPLRDLDQVRAFLSGAGPTAFLDMPWIPLFLIALFLFHPAIGIVATLGAMAIITMTLLTEWTIAKRVEGIDGGKCPAPGAGGRIASERGRHSCTRHDRSPGGTVVARKRALHSTQYTTS